jgi:hypothetical protein
MRVESFTSPLSPVYRAPRYQICLSQYIENPTGCQYNL